MKMLQEDTESLNKLARGRTNHQMLAVINNENPNYREIQQENKELKACLEDYQRTIELVMTKYRHQAQEKILNNKIVLPDIYNKQKDEVLAFSSSTRTVLINHFPFQIIHRQELKIKELMAVMRKASTMDEENINKESEKLVQLIKENEGLRELLEISRQYGSLNRSGTHDDDDHDITQIENLKKGDGEDEEDD